MELRKVIMNTGTRAHLTADGERTLCGKPFYREGDDRSRMCANCDRLAKRRAIIAETTRKAIASINPNHPEAQPTAPAPTDVKVTTRDGERITYAHIPNGDPERVEHFRNLAERSGAFTNITAEPFRKSAAVPAPAELPEWERDILADAPEFPATTNAFIMDGPRGEVTAFADNTATVNGWLRSGRVHKHTANQVPTMADICPCDRYTPVDARSDAMVETEPTGVPETASDVTWDRESTERALSGGPEGAPELNTGHVPLYDFPVTVRKVEPTPAPNAPQTLAWRVVDTNTGDTVTLPAELHTFRGETATVHGIAQPPRVGSEGKVATSLMGRERYPSVFGLRIVPVITPAMAGCWLGGHQGWRNNYRVVDTATEYGFVIPEEYRDALDRYRNGSESEGIHEAICGQGELSDMATDYLNNNAPDGYVFDWDMGELSLVADTEDTFPDTTTGRAVNGHVMEYRVTGMDENGRFTVSQWDAQHSDTCPCVTSGGYFY